MASPVAVGNRIKLTRSHTLAHTLRSGAAAIVALLALLALLVGAQPARAAGKADLPPELLATVAIGPGPTLRTLQAYADAVQPGAGGLVNDQLVRHGLAEIVGAGGLDGFDPAGWLYLLVGTVDSTPTFALLGKVSDAKAVTASAGSLHTIVKAGWAVIGPKPLLDKIAGYAFATISTQPTPRVPTANVFLSQVLARFHPQIEAVKTQMATMAASDPSMGRLMQIYIEGLGSLGDDTERVVITLETTAQIAWLDLALVPRPASRLAKFVALQRPGDYALLDRLPASAASFVLAGHLELGPYRDGMLAAMSQFWGGAAQDVTSQLAAVAKTLTGDFAGAIRLVPGKGMAFTQLYGTSDTSAADKALVTLLDLFKAGRTMTVGKSSSTIRSSAGTTEQRGVALRSYDTTVDLSKMTAAERQPMTAMMPTGTQRAYLGTFDKLTMFVAAPDSLDEAGRAIDAARGKAAHFVASPAIGTLLDATRARKDSFAAVVDIAPFLAAAGVTASELTFLTSLGFADKAMHLRFALPSTTLAAAAKLSHP